MAEKVEGDVNAKLAKLALTDHLVELTNAISASPATFSVIVDGCLQQGLIGPYVHSNLTDTTTRRPLYDKAGELIRNISITVETRAFYLDDFLVILVKNGGAAFQMIAKDIVKNYGCELPKFKAFNQRINPHHHEDDHVHVSTARSIPVLPEQPTPSDIDIQIYQPYFNMKFTDDLLVMLALEDLKPEDAVCVFGMKKDRCIRRILQYKCDQTKIKRLYLMWKRTIPNEATYFIIIEALLRNNHYKITRSIGESLMDKYTEPTMVASLDDPIYFQPEHSYTDWDKFDNNEKERIIDVLQDEKFEIIDCFNETFLNIMDSFEKVHEGNCGKLRMCLKLQLRTLRIHKQNKVYELKEDCRVQDIFNFIKNIGCDWINYHLLDVLTYHHGSEEDKLQMKDYVKKLWTYLQRSLYKIPLPSCEATIAEIHEYHFILPVKGKGDICGQQMKQIQLMLMEKLNIHVSESHIEIKARSDSIFIHYVVNSIDHDDRLTEFIKDTGNDNIYYIDVKWLDIPYNSAIPPPDETYKFATPSPEQKLEQQSLEKTTELDEERRKQDELWKELDEERRKVCEVTRERDELMRQLNIARQANDNLTKITESHQREAPLNQQLQEENQQLQKENQQLQSECQQLLAKEKSWKISHRDVKMTKQELGRGGWGMIWVGQFRGQKVAVKQMYQIIMSEYFLEILHREINTMSQLRHPNLVQFIGAVLDDPSGQPLIVTEIMDMSLREAYEKKQLTPVPVNIPLAVMRDVAVGLNYLHCLPDPIIHRDVSSANVLLESKGLGRWKTKISDFGSAKFAHAAVTKAVGAAAYCAPEAFYSMSILDDEDQLLTPKMDVFSYGVLLCEVLTCQFPHHEVFKTMLEQVRSQHHPYSYDVIQSCIKRNPKDRPDMKQIIQQLDTI